MILNPLHKITPNKTKQNQKQQNNKEFYSDCIKDVIQFSYETFLNFQI